MAESRASIEQRLSQLVQDSAQKSYCERIPVKIFVIVTWILLAGAVGVCGYYTTGWLMANNDLESHKGKIQEEKDKISHLQKLINSSSTELSKKREELGQLERIIKNCTENITIIEQTIRQIESTINRTNNEINETEALLRSEGERRVKLQEEDKKAEKELENVTKLANETKTQHLAVAKQLSSWKLLSGIGFFGTALSALGGLTLTGELTSATRSIGHNKIIKSSFDKVAEERENYVFLSREKKSAVDRTVCFQWKKRGKVSDCYGIHDLITTVATSTGYRFSIVTTVAWKAETVIDKEAYAFSHYLGETAKVRSGRNIQIKASDTLLSFGDKDIILDLQKGKGTSISSSFGGSDGKEFFCPEADFLFDEVIVERIIIKSTG